MGRHPWLSGEGQSASPSTRKLLPAVATSSTRVSVQHYDIGSSHPGQLVPRKAWARLRGEPPGVASFSLSKGSPARKRWGLGEGGSGLEEKKRYS